MTKQLLYYEHVAPISSQRHRDWSLEVRMDHEFARGSSAVPMMAVEFPPAAKEYVIVFAGADEAVRPVVVLGLKPDENLYVDAQGKWDAKYVPAFVRRYPFVLSKTAAEDKLVLSIDEDYVGWNQEGRGSRLFEANGEKTQFFEKTIAFVKDYQRQHAQTQAFCHRLRELDLLAPMTARFKLPSGDQAALAGFMAVDRDRLKGLSGEKLAELAKTDELELVYLHLQSMRNFGTLVARARGDEAAKEFAKEMGEPAPVGLRH